MKSKRRVREVCLHQNVCNQMISIFRSCINHLIQHVLIECLLCVRKFARVFFCYFEKHRCWCWVETGTDEGAWVALHIIQLAHFVQDWVSLWTKLNWARHQESTGIVQRNQRLSGCVWDLLLLKDTEVSLSEEGHPMSPPQSASDLHILCLFIVPGRLKFLVSSMCSWQRLGSRKTYNQMNELMRKMKIGRVTESLVTHKIMCAYDSYRWLVGTQLVGISRKEEKQMRGHVVRSWTWRAGCWHRCMSHRRDIVFSPESPPTASLWAAPMGCTGTGLK